MKMKEKSDLIYLIGSIVVFLLIVATVVGWMIFDKDQKSEKPEPGPNGKVTESADTEPNGTEPETESETQPETEPETKPETEPVTESASDYNPDDSQNDESPKEAQESTESEK